MSEVFERGESDAGTGVSPAEIRRMFGEVAPRYDLLNHLLSASLDRVWRRRAARSIRNNGRAPVLDLCCGTGDQALALSRRQHDVVAADFCIPMLTRARTKYAGRGDAAPTGLAADAVELPFASATFGAATVSFGLRNVPDLSSAIAELRRVLAPGGELVVLEFAMPTLPLLRSLYRFYFRRVLPWIGRRVSDSNSAYTYLPDSVPSFPQRREFVERLVAGGFAEATWTDLSGGIVCLYQATTDSSASAGG